MLDGFEFFYCCSYHTVSVHGDVACHGNYFSWLCVGRFWHFRLFRATTCPNFLFLYDIWDPCYLPTRAPTMFGMSYLFGMWMELPNAGWSPPLPNGAIVFEVFCPSFLLIWSPPRSASLFSYLILKIIVDYVWLPLFICHKTISCLLLHSYFPIFHPFWLVLSLLDWPPDQPLASRGPNFQDSIAVYFQARRGYWLLSIIVASASMVLLSSFYGPLLNPLFCCWFYKSCEIAEISVCEVYTWDVLEPKPFLLLEVTIYKFYAQCWLATEDATIAYWPWIYPYVNIYYHFLGKATIITHHGMAWNTP